MFNFLMSSFTTLLQVFFGLPIELAKFQLHRSPKYAILIPTFYMRKPSQPHFPLPMFKVLHSTPCPVILLLTCILTFYDQNYTVASSPSSLCVFFYFSECVYQMYDLFWLSIFVEATDLKKLCDWLT